MTLRTTTIAAAFLLASTMPCRAAPAATADDPVIHYRSGPGHFAIPQSLFLGGEHPPDGGTDDGALLLLSWPGLRGNPEEGNGLQVLLMPLEKEFTADAYIERRIQILTRPLQNLPRYRDPSPLDFEPIASADSHRPRGPGMRFVANARPLPNSWWSEIYVDNPNRPDTVIACIPIDAKNLSPSCIQQFVTRGLTVQVTYPRKFVSDWASIRDRLADSLQAYYRRDRE